MSFKMIEGVLRGLQSYLVANLPAKLSALNTEYGDGLTLEAPKAYLFSEQSLNSIKAYPIVYLLGEDTKIDVWYARVGPGSSMESTHRVQIGIIFQSQDYSNLRFFGYRYPRAIWECLLEGYAARAILSDGAPVMIDTGNRGVAIEFSPIFSRNSNYIADADIRFSAQMSESK